MISGGSCDTEDWSNDAENSGINYILKYIKQKKYFQLQQYFTKLQYVMYPTTFSKRFIYIILF